MNYESTSNGTNYISTSKGTFNDSHVELWAPFVKTTGESFIAVLSDDSIDRDGEVVGKEAMMKIKDDKTFLTALMDHENKVLNQVGEWVNKRVEEVDGHTTLIAEPRFFKSNPNAQIIEGMLKEGAKMGVSIGAIVKDKEEREVMGKTRTVFTDLELVEASFVAIPSNRHAHAMAVAKSYEENMEVSKMPEELKKEESAVEESQPVEEEVQEPEPVKEEAEESQPEAEAEPEAEDPEKKFDLVSKEFQESIQKLNGELAATREELKELKKMSVLKAKVEVQEEEVSKGLSEEDMKAGKIPVLRM